MIVERDITATESFPVCGGWIRTFERAVEIQCRAWRSHPQRVHVVLAWCNAGLDAIGAESEAIFQRCIRQRDGIYG